MKTGDKHRYIPIHACTATETYNVTVRDKHTEQHTYINTHIPTERHTYRHT